MNKRYLTTEQRRSVLKLAYNDRNWIDKVDKMPNKQVYAIFDKMKMDGKIDFDNNGNLIIRTDKEVKELKRKREITHGYHQITLDEFFGDILEQRKGEQ